MSATAVRPQASGVIFPLRSLLQQQFPVGVEYKDREGSMQYSAKVSLKLFRRTSFVVELINYNHTIYQAAYLSSRRLSNPLDSAEI